MALACGLDQTEKAWFSHLPTPPPSNPSRPGPGSLSVSEPGASHRCHVHVGGQLVSLQMSRLTIRFEYIHTPPRRVTRHFDNFIITAISTVSECRCPDGQHHSSERVEYGSDCLLYDFGGQFRPPDMISFGGLECERHLGNKSKNLVTLQLVDAYARHRHV